jgi:hypothetical protein
MASVELKNEPYCGNCGYLLTGAVDSSKCPECGKPIVEVLRRKGMFAAHGKRYRSKVTLFGLPVVSVALGPSEGEIRGVAKGIIAVGDVAIGFLAVGGVSIGIVAVGGATLGLFALGGLAIGLLTAMGGTAIGGAVVGGAAIGVLAFGAGAAGIWAQGVGAAGTFVRSMNAAMRRGATGSPPGFEQVTWFFGPWPPDATTMLRPVAVAAGAPLLAAAVIGLVAWLAIRRQGSASSAGSAVT